MRPWDYEWGESSEQAIRALLSKASSLARVNIVLSDDPEMVMAINTYGDKLSKPDLIINRNAVKQQRNFTDPQIIYILEHEMGHYDEEAKLRATPAGQLRYESHLHAMEQRWTVIRNKLRSFENAMRDVWVNMRTVRADNMPVLSLETRRLYGDIFFKQKNYLDKPLHVQLEYAVLREMMISDQQCIVDPRVRGILNWLFRSLPWGRRADLLVEGTLGERYDFFEQEMWDKWMYLYTIDVWEKKQEKNEKWKEKNEKSWQSEENSQDLEKSQQNNGSPCEVDPATSGARDDGNAEKNEEWWETEWLNRTKKSWPTKQDLDDIDLSAEPDYWEWDQHDQLPHFLEQLPPEQLDALLDDMLQQALEEQAKIDEEAKEQQEKETNEQKERNKPERQKKLEHRVEQMWIDRADKNFKPTVKQLQQYEDYVDKLINEVKDETWKKVFDQLVKLFDTIKSENSKLRHNIRGPVDQEHWERLYGPAIASGIASVLWWETNPEMRAKDVKQEKKKQYVWNIEVEIYADGTWSMGRWTRTRDQKQAIILMIEALKKLEDKSKASRNPLITPFTVKTGVSIFGSKSRIVKQLWSGISDAERLSIFWALNENDGPNNNEWVLLKKAFATFARQPQEYKDAIKKWSPKKIVFVLTDWWQDVPQYQKKLEKAIQDFRDAWVIVYGVAMCNDADDVDEIYGTMYSHQWWSIHCGTPDKLGNALSKTMQPHLLKFTSLK
jgi:hypothetical protein